MGAVQNNQFYVWGKEVYLPFDGVVTSANSSFPDNVPDITAAVEIEDAEDGSAVDLEERPSNGVEVTPGGPFLLRLLHFRHPRRRGGQLGHDLRAAPAPRLRLL